jgi:hypothetical protein
MNRIYHTLFSFVFLAILSQIAEAQQAPTSRLVWKVNKVDLGTVLEEQGPQVAEFSFTHTQDSLFFIEKVWTDCGCTTADFTSDTLKVGETGSVKVSFDPASGAGFFSRIVVVKGNLAGTQDTLFIEGTAVPYPENPDAIYGVKKADLGFRLPKVNMGEVFTNEPKFKQVEFFNFSKSTLKKSELVFQGPSYITISQVQDSIRSQERGLLLISYDGKAKNDLGFFEDRTVISWGEKQKVEMDILADVFEYFAPFAKGNLNTVPQLFIENKEVNLGSISPNAIQTRTVNLTNKGQQVLEIRKIQGNCECLKLEMVRTTINPGETLEMKITFDPKGRLGIDQRNIYIFSNDPVNSVQLVVVKSRVE